MLLLALLVSASLDGNASFIEGRKLYDQLEYEQSVFRFQQAALTPNLAPQDRATVFVWLGLSFAGAGDFDAARRSFTDAARANPAITLPVEVSAKLAQLFADAKAAAAREPAPLAPEPKPAHAPAADDPPWLAGTGAAVGGVVLAAGIGAGVLCALSYGTATDKTQFAVDAKAALDAANVELLAAGILIPAGVAVAGASTVLLVTRAP